jgi:hypothetical protein
MVGSNAATNASGRPSGGVSPPERKGEDAAERQSGHARSVETQVLEESGEAVGIVIEAEPFGRVG